VKLLAIDREGRLVARFLTISTASGSSMRRDSEDIALDAELLFEHLLRPEISLSSSVHPEFGRHPSDEGLGLGRPRASRHFQVGVRIVVRSIFHARVAHFASWSHDIDLPPVPT